VNLWILLRAQGIKLEMSLVDSSDQITLCVWQSPRTFIGFGAQRWQGMGTAQAHREGARA